METDHLNSNFRGQRDSLAHQTNQRGDLEKKNARLAAEVKDLQKEKGSWAAQRNDFASKISQPTAENNDLKHDRQVRSACQNSEFKNRGQQA